MTASNAVRHRGTSKDTYHDYCKPKLTELLSCLGLAQSYTKASGCTLWTESGRQVVDFIGGFGAAIAGHNHPDLVDSLVRAVSSNVPIQAQASVRGDSARLAA